MVIDTSVLIAILLNEPETEGFAAAISAAPSRLISAVSALETAIVIDARDGLQRDDWIWVPWWFSRFSFVFVQLEKNVKHIGLKGNTHAALRSCLARS